MNGPRGTPYIDPDLEALARRSAEIVGVEPAGVRIPWDLDADEHEIVSLAQNVAMPISSEQFPGGFLLVGNPTPPSFVQRMIDRVLNGPPLTIQKPRHYGSTEHRRLVSEALAIGDWAAKWRRIYPRPYRTIATRDHRGRRIFA